tara:strand:- start:98 stop:388 length:291 start_codon:yes stop_codon:yes gene_type:complete
MKKLLVKLLAIGVIVFVICNNEHNLLTDLRFQNVVQDFPFDKRAENEFSDLIDIKGQETDLAQNDLIHQSKKMLKHDDFTVSPSVFTIILIMVVLL